MHQNTLFKITNLNCSYDQKTTVLNISDLVIPKGELIFVLGISGIGKSTFIETLGLMNNTIYHSNETSISFFPSITNDGIELKDSWKISDTELASFRNQYFSFIFQNTNLMPNFTAGENMCISQLIEGMPLSTARKTVSKVMEELNLPKEVFDKKITALSGGQRQRLAFVRAITANFEVLFGDEPTGNLDKDTAYRLMRILKQNLRKYHRTGIIVSHDIDLALSFADRIILLTFKEENKQKIYGEVLPENVIASNDENKWFNSSNERIEEVSAFIYKLLKINPLKSVV